MDEGISKQAAHSKADHDKNYLFEPLPLIEIKAMPMSERKAH